MYCSVRTRREPTINTSETAETYTVLIVDDNAEDRYLLKRFLSKTDLPLVVLEAASGREGIDLLCTPLAKMQQDYPGLKTPIALFLDINMPIMNGWEFVEELESRDDEIELKPTVVMMYSTSDADEEKRKASNYQAVAGYIVKGESSPDVLRQAIIKVRASV